MLRFVGRCRSVGRLCVGDPMMGRGEQDLHDYGSLVDELEDDMGTGRGGPRDMYAFEDEEGGVLERMGVVVAVFCGIV